MIISWECQIFDTNFHYMVDSRGNIMKKDGEVCVDDNVWIANRVSIAKGSFIPRDSIIASNSLVNKDFSKSESGIFAGIPAKLMKPAICGEFLLQSNLNDYFKAHPQEKIVSVHSTVNQYAESII